MPTDTSLSFLMSKNALMDFLLQLCPDVEFSVRDEPLTFRIRAWGSHEHQYMYFMIMYDKLHERDQERTSNRGCNPDGFSELPGRKRSPLPGKSVFLPGIRALQAWVPMPLPTGSNFKAYFLTFRLKDRLTRFG